MAKRYTDEEKQRIIAAVKDRADGTSVEDACKKLKVSAHTYANWIGRKKRKKRLPVETMKIDLPVQAENVVVIQGSARNVADVIQWLRSLG